MTRIGISKNYITGQFKSCLPEIHKKGLGGVVVRDNGCWSEKDELRVLDSAQNDIAKGSKNVKFKESDISSGDYLVYLSLRTEYGFNIVYEFRVVNDRNKPTKVSITFPWSKKPVEFRP